MATAFNLYIDVIDEQQAQACFQAVADEIDRIEQIFSRFRPSSEISRINRQAADGPVVTDPETFRLLAAAVELSRMTGGVFDITVGRLTRAWGFADRSPGVPAPEALAAAKACCGWKNLELDPDWRTVHFLRPGLEIDLGGIAKGYAVDRALDVLRACSVSGVIDAGSSSIAATNEPFGSSWMVQIKNPMDSAIPLGEVLLGTRALSSSGVLEQSFVHQGRIHSHLIDPTSHGFAAAPFHQQVLQTTVMAQNSMLADALSTAMFLLGPDRGAELLQTFEGVSALWITAEGERMGCSTFQWPGNILSSCKESTHG